MRPRQFDQGPGSDSLERPVETHPCCRQCDPGLVGQQPFLCCKEHYHLSAAPFNVLRCYPSRSMTVLNGPTTPLSSSHCITSAREASGH